MRNSAISMRPLVTVLLLTLVPFFAAASEIAEPSEEQLERGKQLVFERCADCHTLQRAFSGHYDMAGWHDAIDRMKAEGLEIEPEEQQDVAVYMASQEDRPTGWTALGRFHFLILHFPIALISLLAIFEIIAWRQRRGIAKDGLHLLVRLAAFMSIPTIIFGLALVADRTTMPAGLLWHRNFGILTGVSILLAWLARELVVRTYSRRPVMIYYVSLAVATIAVALAGDLGGALVHGSILDALIGMWHG